MRLKIDSFPRLHLSLIAMGPAGYRVNGGIGFAVNSPPISIRTSPSKTNDNVQVEDDRAFPLEDNQIRELTALIYSFLKRHNLRTGVILRIEGAVPTHGGFGSNTAIRLACLESLSRLFGLNLSRRDLVIASQRGGTSGIGISTYFDGGFVLDVGHGGANSELGPSSSKIGHSMPVVLAQFPMPDWDIGICFPRGIPRKTRQEEYRFFRKHCPLTSCMIYEILYHCVYGVAAAVKSGNFGDFCDGIRALQTTGWKKAERGLYGPSILKIESLYFRIS